MWVVSEFRGGLPPYDIHRSHSLLSGRNPQWADCHPTHPSLVGDDNHSIVYPQRGTTDSRDDANISVTHLSVLVTLARVGYPQFP